MDLKTLFGLIEGAALVALVPVALIGLARALGMGKCKRCGVSIPPWNAYCGPHGPYGKEDDETGLHDLQEPDDPRP
jgi:hypothetical protein